MDELVKRRLVGAALLTGLAVLIVPYFFEDKTPPSAIDLPLPMDSAPSSAAASVNEIQAPLEPVETVRPESPPQASAPQASAPVRPKKYGTVPLDEGQALTPAPSNPVQPPAPPVPIAPAPPVTPPTRLPPPVAPASLTPKLQKPQTSTSPTKPVEPPAALKPPVKKAEALKPVKPVTAPGSTEVVAKKTPSASPPPQKASPSGTAPATASKPQSNPAYLVQAGTFSDENNAKSLVDKLRKRNLPVRIQAIDGTQGGKVYRVTVGPNLDHNRAEQIQKQLAEQDGVRALILQTR